MKKFSLLFAALLFAGSMIATDVTFEPTDFPATTSADYSATKGGVTVSVTASTAVSDHLRIFKYQSITISADSNISSIVFTCPAMGANKYGPGCFGAGAPAGYTFEENGFIGTWTGSATSLTFTASDNQVRVTQLVVTLGGASGDTTVVPVDTTVVPVDTTTIVYNTCADVNAVTANTNMTLGEVTVVYAKGTHIYVKDATATTLVYTNKYSTLKAGDRVSGIAGEAKLYHNLPELAATTKLADLVITEGEAPVIFDAQAAPTAANINQVMMFRGVQMPTASFTTTYATNITGIFAGEEVAFRNNWKEAYDFDSTQIYNILGCVAIYNSTIQVYAAQIIEKPVLYPVAFLDWDGTVLTRDSIACGAAATAPAAPIREGYEFLGWSKDYSNIQGEMFIIALYEQEQAPVEGILVSYIDGVDNSLIGNDTIVLNIPEAPIHEGYTFQGWMTVVGNPEDGITIQATYQNNDPTQVQQQTYVPEAGETRKVFENGKVYVVRNGKTFTMQGQEVR